MECSYFSFLGHVSWWDDLETDDDVEIITVQGIKLFWFLSRDIVLLSLTEKNYSFISQFGAAR